MPNVMDQISEYLFGFNKQTPYNPPSAPGADLLYDIGYGFRPSTLRETMGPMLGVQKTPYQDLGLAQRTIGLPAELMKMLGKVTNPPIMAGARAFKEGATGAQGRRDAASAKMLNELTMAKKEAKPKAASKTIDVKPEKVETIKAGKKGKAKVDPMQMIFNIESIMAKHGLRTEQARQNVRRKYAARLVEAGLDPVVAGMWIQGGPQAFQSLFEGGVKMGMAGARGGRGRSSEEMLHQQRVGQAERDRGALLRRLITDPEARDPSMTKGALWWKKPDFDMMRQFAERQFPAPVNPQQQGVPPHIMRAMELLTQGGPRR